MANYCTNCGTPLKPEWNACTNCGTIIRKAGLVYIPPKTTAYFPPKTTAYIPPKAIKLPLILRIVYIGFGAIFAISLRLPYMHISPSSYFYYGGNVIGFTIIFLIYGIGFIIPSIILTFTEKIKASLILGLIGFGFGLLGIIHVVYRVTNPDPSLGYIYLGIGFYFGLISLIGIAFINFGICLFYLLKARI